MSRVNFQTTFNPSNKPPFPEPPPSVDVNDPSWAQAFQEWWWRKCDYYGIDPIEAFAAMLEDPEDDPEDK